MSDKEKVTVVTSALRAEAKKWASISDRLMPIADAAINAGLSKSAFFPAPPWDASAHSGAYNNFQQSMTDVLYEGVTECAQMSLVLKEIADNYDVSDEDAAQNLDKIYSL